LLKEGGLGRKLKGRRDTAMRRRVFWVLKEKGAAAYLRAMRTDWAFLLAFL